MRKEHHSLCSGKHAVTHLPFPTHSAVACYFSFTSSPSLLDLLSAHEGEGERSPPRRRPCSCGERDKTQLDSERETERGRERENKTFMKVKERFLHLCKQCLFIQQVIKINMYCKCYYCCCCYYKTKTIMQNANIRILGMRQAALSVAHEMQ